MQFPAYDSLYRIIFSAVGTLALVFANVALVFIWPLIGCTLWTTKVFCFVAVHNLWLLVWTGTKKHADTSSPNGIISKLLNRSLSMHVFLQTIPNLVIQIINSTLLDLWSPVSLLSVSFTAFNALNGAYRTGYYVFYKGYRLEDIPLDEFDLLCCVIVDPNKVDYFFLYFCTGFLLYTFHYFDKSQ